MNSTHDMTDPELVWILNDSLTGILDAATWVETARELQRLGWRVVLLTTDTEEQAAGLADVEVTSLTPPSIYALRQVIFHFRAARYVLKRWREVDIVVFHHQSAFWLLPLMWGARLSGRQAPCFVMDTRTVPMTVRNLKAKLRARYEWSMYRLGRLWAHGHTAITLRMAEAVGIRGQKLWGVWPSGVNVDSFASAHANRCWPSAEQALNIIYVGTLYPERNVLMACEAVAAANQAGMQITFTIVGSGPQWQDLADFAATSGGMIRVLPAVPHAQVPELLAGAHAGILPFPDDPIFRVSSPIKLFEYMAAGLPILATRIVCHTDVLEDADYAFWMEEGDPNAMVAGLSQLWNERHRLPELGAQAAADASKWSWTSAAQKFDIALRHGLELWGGDGRNKSKSRTMARDRG